MQSIGRIKLLVVVESDEDTRRNDARGGKIARKKAKLAVARELAVTVIALLKDPSRKYVPLSEAGRAGFERYRAEQAGLPERSGRAVAV